ncbi:MAG: hypothetical protein R3A48_21915 [Polyangiales bacterium]
MRKALIAVIYLAWGQVSCAEGGSGDVITADAAVETDVPALPDVINDSPELVDDTPDVVSAADVVDVPDAPDVVDAPEAAPVPDSLPTDSVMLFRETECPRGWAPYHDAAGRAMAVAANPALNGYRLGTQLADREERAHTHSYGGTFALESVSYVGVVGGGNSGTSAVGTLMYRAQTSMESAGIPYVQLLACIKTGPAVPRAQPLPSGMLIFYSGSSCPTGYTQPMVTRGRVMVGLPATGINGATFGGAPIGADSPARHAHNAITTLTTEGHGIALASGCCGGGYARNGTYQEMARTEDNEPGMPTIQLLQCQKD